MHYLYILHSKEIDKYYIGETANLEHRILQHNTHYFPKNFTKAANDWKIVLSFKLDNKEDACYLEQFLKRMKSKLFIQKVIKNTNILSDILSKK